MSRNGAGDDSDSIENSFKPSRRSYIKAVGAAAISIPLLSGQSTAATERHGISFDKVVDMVDDAGCDPNGNEACDGKLRSAADSNTLLKFPSGTYKFTEKNMIEGNGNFGILGEGDTTFTVPSDYNDKLLAINYGSGVLVENITVEQNGASPNVQVAPNDGLEVHDLTITGQDLESSDSAEDAFTPMVRSSGGEGMVENLVAHNAGRMGAYARTGVWIGRHHKGAITLRNCNVEGFSNNGLYASRTSGVVKVEGGTYKNNDQAQVRLGSSGSYAEGVTAVVDADQSNSPNPGDMDDANGFRIEKPDGGSGAAIRDCDIRMGPAANTGGGIKVYSNYDAFTVENTRLEYNASGYAIRARSPDGSGDAGGTLQNVSVTGDATDLVGVLIEGRSGTTVENCCIQQTGSNRTGLALDNSNGSTVKDCTINAGAQALRVRNGNVNVSGLNKSGSCPTPNLSSSSYDGSSSGGSSSNGSSSGSSSNPSDSSSGNPNGSGSDNSLSGNINESNVPKPSGNANFMVTDTSTKGGRIPYTVTTTGNIQKTGSSGATQDSNDNISGHTVSGGVNQWRDAYKYEGEIASFEADGRATIKLDSDAGTIKVLGNDDSGTDYSLEVTGTLTHADDSGDPIAADGHSVSGGVGTSSDAYNYTGRLVQASIEDSVSITTDPSTLTG